MMEKMGYYQTFKKLIKLLYWNKKAFWGAVFLSVFKTVFSVATSIGIGVVIQNAFLKLESDIPLETNQAWITLIIGCSLILAGYILYFFAYLFSQQLILKLTYHVGYSIRDLFFNKIRKIPYQIVEKAARGDLISRGTTDTNALAINLSICIGEIFTAPLVIIGIVIGLLIISPLLTAITLVFFVISVTVSLFLSLKAAPKYMKMQTEIGNLNGVVEEYVGARKAIKSFCYEQQAIDLFKSINQRQANESRNAETRLNFIWPLNDVIETFMYAILYFIGIIFYINNIHSGSIFFPTFEIGLLTSFVMLARIVTSETSNSLRLIGSLQKTTVVTKRIFEILEEKEIVDSGTISKTFSGKIEFDHVYFEYSKNKPVLKDVSFTINPNETVAIVGPTGSGKTTMTSLLTRFYEIKKGMIKIDEINIQDIQQESLFANIAVVLQDPFLFSESIYQNIWYGNPNAKENDVMKVSQKANVDYFIQKLPNGYNTIMSEKMSDLSLGQIQLVAIARAFMSDAKILILDEATSFVDSKTEIDIQNALMQVTKNKTVIVIAHRLSTVVKADKIIVLKDGQIQEIGTHQQLLQSRGFYYSLYQANAIMEDYQDIQNLES